MQDDEAIPPAGRRVAPEAVWAEVRRDYTDGVSAPECCRRHGVGLTALRDRAAREEWRRKDLPWVPPRNRLDPEDEGVALEARANLDQIEIRQLWYVAHRRMLRAVLRGDAVEALRWRRVAQAMDEESAEMQRMIDQDEELWRERRSVMDYEAAHPDGPDASDASDGVFSSAPPSA